MKERQIRYRNIVHPIEQGIMNNHWTFFILNTPDKIERVLPRIQEYFASNYGNYDDWREFNTDEVLVKEDSLHGKLVMLKSSKGIIYPKSQKRIYGGKWVEDRDLRTMNETEFHKYAARFKDNK